MKELAKKAKSGGAKLVNTKSGGPTIIVDIFGSQAAMDYRGLENLVENTAKFRDECKSARSEISKSWKNLE